jgi:hypothetical protein
MSADWTPITLKKELQDLANSLSESDDLLQNISENELFVSVGFSKLGQLPLPKRLVIYLCINAYYVAMLLLK